MADTATNQTSGRRAADDGDRAPTNAVNSVVAALRVLEEVSVAQPIGVSDLARRLDMPKSNVQRLARTLEHAGWLRPIDLGGTRWALTMRAFTVGQNAVLEQGLRETARLVMEELSRSTGETVHLLVPDGNELVSIERFESAHAIRIHQPLGGRAPYHATSPGKAVLAALADDEARRRIGDRPPGYTRFTITDPDELIASLVGVRARRYATNRGEWRDGVGAVGAAIELTPGNPVAAIAISMPIERFPPEKEEPLGAAVADAARLISQRLGAL